MGKNSFFTKLKLDNEIFLAPFGSAAAAAVSPVEINESFAQMWESGDIPSDIKKDLPGKLFSNLPDTENYGPSNFSATVAGTKLKFWDFTGGTSLTLKKFLDKFQEGEGEEHKISIFWDKSLVMDKMSLLLLSDDLSVLENDEYYLMQFHAFECAKKLIIKKNLTASFIYMKKTSDMLEEELEMAVRNIFALLQLKKGRVFLHSSSILYKEKVWCFSADAGTGKTTHTDMWIKAGSAQAINGDLNLLGIEDGMVKVYGTPWCGTSGIYSEKDFELEGIVLLQRGKENLASDMDKHKSISVLARLISPVWDEEMLMVAADITQTICQTVKVLKLECRPDEDAYLTMKAYIDGQ